MHLNKVIKAIAEFDKKINNYSTIEHKVFVNFLHKERHNLIRFFLQKNNINIYTEIYKIGYKYKKTIFMITGKGLQQKDLLNLRKIGIVGTGQRYWIAKIKIGAFRIVDLEEG